MRRVLVSALCSISLVLLGGTTLAAPGGGHGGGGPTAKVLSAGFNLASEVVAEEDGSGVYTATVHRSGLTRCASTVHWATADGDATDPADYTASSGTLAFAKGADFARFTVPLEDDALVEPDEAFTITLDTPATTCKGVSATLGTSVLTVTLANADVQLADGSLTLAPGEQADISYGLYSCNAATAGYAVDGNPTQLASVDLGTCGYNDVATVVNPPEATADVELVLYLTDETCGSALYVSDDSGDAAHAAAYSGYQESPMSIDIVDAGTTCEIQTSSIEPNKGGGSLTATVTVSTTPAP